MSKNGQTYTYGSSKPHAVTSDGSQPSEYDDNGNMTRRGSLYLKYNAENRMAKASSDSGGSVYIGRFAHDGDGRRVKRVDNYGTIHYMGPHYERNVGTGADTTEVITRFYFAQMGGMRRLIALRRTVNGVSTLYYIVPDHLGGTARVVDTAGNWIDDIRYNAFGATRSGGTTTPTDKRFTGQTLDASTGLYWYGSRAYDPVLGRFVQPDSVVPDYKNPQALNRYSYVLNNPLRYTDPTGNMWETEDEGGGGSGDPDGTGDAGGPVDDGGGALGYSGPSADVSHVLPADPLIQPTGVIDPEPDYPGEFQFESGYVDLNVTVGEVLGYTTGVLTSPIGEYPYGGGGVTLGSPISASLTHSDSEPVPGWTAGAQVNIGLALQVGWSFGEGGGFYWEKGVGFPPGVALTFFKVGEPVFKWR